jgi:hypothetical protein
VIRNKKKSCEQEQEEELRVGTRRRDGSRNKKKSWEQEQEELGVGTRRIVILRAGEASPRDLTSVCGLDAADENR